VPTNGGSPTHPWTVGARHAVPLPCAYPQVGVHERPRASPRPWSDGKMPAPQHNRGGSGTRPDLDQHHSPFAIRHSLALRCSRQGAATLRPYDFADLPQGRVWDPPLPGPAPFAIRRFFHWLFAVFLRSPLAARRSRSFTIRHSQLATRHSPLAVFHHSPVAIRHSLYFPFAILGGRSLVPPPHAECSARFGARIDRCATLRAMLPFAALCG
jgi:hypothetical protein